MIPGTPLDAYLDPGETLVWSGQPKQGMLLQAADMLLIPFSLVWGGGAFIFEGSVTGLLPLLPKGLPSPLLYAVLGIPFCIVGLYLLVGRFFFDAYARGKTRYGVTHRRVIVYKSALRTKINFIDYPDLTELNLIERKDNSGDILFDLPGAWSNMAGAGGWPVTQDYAQAPGFYFLPQARTVYNLIRKLQSKVKK